MAVRYDHPDVYEEVSSIVAGADLVVRRTIDELEDWLVIEGHRGVVAATVLVAGTLVVTAIQLAEVGPQVSTSAFTNLFSAFLAGNLTLITVVLSINQLVLSRSMRSPRELRDEISAAIDYRDEVQDQTYQFVSPDDSTYFLHLLLDSVGHHVGTLQEARDDEVDAELRDALAELVDTITAHVGEMNASLVEADVGQFQSLTMILRHDVGEQINRCRLVQHRFGDELNAETDETLDAIQSRLELFEVARQYFMTIYLTEELAQFSRTILYVGFPPVVGAISMLFLLGDVTGGTTTTNSTTLPVLSAVLLSFAPLAVLFSYVLRISTLAEFSSAISPFTTTD